MMRWFFRSRRAKLALILLSAVAGISLAAAVTQSHSARAGQERVVARYLARGDHVVASSPGGAISALHTGRGAINIPSSVESVLSELSSPSTGTVDLSNVRELLTEPHAWGGTLYATVSSTGEACYFITGGPAGCVAQFNAITPIAFDKFDRDGPGGDPVVVAGLVPDDVQAIDVTAGTDTYSADLKNNAFFYQLPSSQTAPVTALTIHYTDGSSLNQPLAPLVSEQP